MSTDLDQIHQLKARSFRASDPYRRTAESWRIATMRLRRRRVEIDGNQTFPPPAA